jgi:hypothetical protein
MKRPILCAIGVFLCCLSATSVLHGKREGRSIRTRPPLNSTMNITHSESTQMEVNIPSPVKISLSPTPEEIRLNRSAVDIPGEEWRTIPSHPRYEASSLGRIRSLYGAGQFGMHLRRSVPKILAQCVNCRHHYLSVTLGPWKGWGHIVVCEAFHGRRPDGYESAHGDGSRNNNRADNLSWKTCVENNRDKIAHGTHRFGERAANSILKEEQVRFIKGSTISQRLLGLKFGVSPSAIQNIKDGNAWKHVA